MKTLLLTTALVALVGCAASSSTQTARPEFPAYDVKVATTHQALQATAATAKPTTVEAAPPAGPVSLTQEKSYIERFDPSGWSGLSTPAGGIGGGPNADDNPYYETEAE